MEEGCTIDGKFHNLEVENLLTTGEFALSDTLTLKEIVLEENITVGTTATIGSNLIVDTDTLVVNATTNNVGIGIAAPINTLKLDVAGNVKIRGDLEVIGTTTETTEESTTISGPIQELGTGTTGTPANDMGIVMERGDQPNAFMGWDESADKFIMGVAQDSTTNNITSLSTGDLTIVQKDLQVSGIVATNLTGTILTAAQPNITTIGTITSGTWQGTAIADAYISSAATWNAKQDSLTFGIGNDNVIKCGSNISDDDFLKINGDTLEGRSASEVKTDLSLNNVENTAISTFAGSTNITTLGTIGTGVWQGTPISIANGGTGATTTTAAASALGVGTEDTPQFTAINLGHASDTTIARSSAGVVTIEGSEIRTGTVPTNKGGTGETSYDNGKLLIGNSTIGSSGGLTSSTLTPGDGISILNGNGSITISATASEFIGLTDTPSSYSSQANNTPSSFSSQEKKILQVNSSNNGLEFTNTPVFSTIGLLVTGSSNQFTVGVDNSDSNKFKIGTTAIDTNTRLTIDSSGKVGIGNSSPGNLLHLQSTTTPQLKIGYDNTNFSTISVASNSDTTFATAQSGVFNFSDNVNAQAGLDVTGGDITITGSSSTVGLTINNTDTSNDAIIKLASDGSTRFIFGIDGGDNDKFKISTDSSNISSDARFTIDSSGNVGIGTTSSQSLLHLESSTTPQFIIGYDNNNYSTISVASNSDTTFATQQSGVFNFSDNINAQAGLDVTGASLNVDNQAITQSTGGQVTFAGNVDATAGLDVTGAALTITNQAITQSTGGQVTFAGNVDATSGLDVTGAALTITNQAITQSTGGQVTFAGNVDATSGLDVTGAALTIDNQAITQSTGGQVTFAGNVDANAGLDVTGAALTTDQVITQSGSGQVTFTGNVDATAGLDVTGGALTIDNQAITQSTGGQVTFAGNVDANAGLDVTGGALNITDQSITQTGTNANTLTGPTTLSNTVTVGVDDTGYDVKFFGATSGSYMLWDESDDDLKLAGAAGLVQTGTGQVTFAGNLNATNGIILGNSTSTTNGTLQWTGTKLQLYHNQWINISLETLYSFNTFGFTRCGKTGRYGPSLTDCINTYGTGSNWWNNTSYFNVNTAGFQEWTVPSSGIYKIEAGGAKGGTSHFNSPGGNGAKVITYFNLTIGEVIKIIVGQQGTNGNTGSSGSGGGGGTYVLKSPYNTTASVIVVGGGGGGGTSTHYHVAGGNGGTVQSTTTTGGSVVGVYYAGAGAGFNNDGAGYNANSVNFTGGSNITSTSYSVHGLGYGGSQRISSGWNFVGPGGFGGGGGNGAHDSGGGGGYNGGNSGRAAQAPQTASTGGGSYINSSGSSSSFTTHTGSHGYVTITKQ
jgi:hypothetical protein